MMSPTTNRAVGTKQTFRTDFQCGLRGCRCLPLLHMSVRDFQSSQHTITDSQNPNDLIASRKSCCFLAYARKMLGNNVVESTIRIALSDSLLAMLYSLTIILVYRVADGEGERVVYTRFHDLLQIHSGSSEPGVIVTFCSRCHK